MHITITVKAEAESRQELIDTFGDQVQNLRAHFDALKTEGVFGDPQKADLRYLVVGGQFRVPVEEHGTPTVEES